ncbi:MAG: TfoX/Sxy family protein [Anaerolineae bacterium]
MAFSEELAERVRAILADRPDVVEKKMFGGLTFMVRGNMCCGIQQDGLMVRVGPEKYTEALAQPRARAMDLGGRPMRGMVMEGLASDAALAAWVEQGVQFASSLPAK